MNKQLITFNVMTAVQASYAEEKLTDSEFAKRLTAILKVDISTARVRQARAALQIPNNSPENKLEIELRRAKELLAETLTGMKPELKKQVQEFLA